MTTATAPNPLGIPASEGDADATDAAVETTPTEGQAEDASTDSGKTLLTQDTPPQEPEKAATSITVALPNDSPLDADVLPRITDLAQKAGVTDAAHVQAIVDVLHGEAVALIEATQSAYKQGGREWTAMVQKMEAEALRDPALGANDPAKLTQAVTEAKAVIGKFAPEGFTTFLDESGLGSDPRFLKFARAVYAGMKEDALVAGSPPPAKPKTAAQRMYPTLPSKEG